MSYSRSWCFMRANVCQAPDRGGIQAQRSFVPSKLANTLDPSGWNKCTRIVSYAYRNIGALIAYCIGDVATGKHDTRRSDAYRILSIHGLACRRRVYIL